MSYNLQSSFAASPHLCRQQPVITRGPCTEWHRSGSPASHRGQPEGQHGSLAGRPEGSGAGVPRRCVTVVVGITVHQAVSMSGVSGLPVSPGEGIRSCIPSFHPTSLQIIRIHLLFRSFSLLPSCAHVLVGNPLSPTGTPRAGGCWGQGRELRLEWGSCSPEAAESDAPEKMPSRVRTGLHPEPTAQPHQVSAWCLACG